MQHEITEKIPLLDEEGVLTQPGYAKNMLWEYDRRKVKAARHRIKEWDYYYIGNEDYGVALTIADNSYMGLISASVLDFRVPKEKTTSVMTLLPLGKTGFPADSFQGDVTVKNARIDFQFKNDGTARRVTCSMKNFDHGKDFFADIRIFQQPGDTMVIATPFREKKTAFYYNQKINCMAARGYARVGNTRYEFDEADSTATLDWGRGVWTYSNTWYWGSASGKVDGIPFGFNIGYGFGDTSAATENMLFYDGKAHKLEDVTFHIPTLASGKEDYLSPWKFTSSDGRFEMDFEPILDRYANTNALLISSCQHQVFGRFTGTAVLDSGQKIHLERFLGFAEKVKNRW